MFTVYDKENKEVKVYDVQRDKNGYPQFLIRQDNQWIYRSAKHYTTEQKRDISTFKRIMCNHEWHYDSLCENKRSCCKCGKEQREYYGTWCDTVTPCQSN